MLKGGGPPDLIEVTYALAREMLDPRDRAPTRSRQRDAMLQRRDRIGQRAAEVRGDHRGAGRRHTRDERPVAPAAGAAPQRISPRPRRHHAIGRSDARSATASSRSVGAAEHGRQHRPVSGIRDRRQARDARHRRPDACHHSRAERAGCRIGPRSAVQSDRRRRRDAGRLPLVSHLVTARGVTELQGGGRREGGGEGREAGRGKREAYSA